MHSPPKSGPGAKDHAVRRILGSFSLITVVMAIVAVSSARNISRSVAASDWVNHTHAVMIEVDAVMGSLQDSEAAVLAYAETGDARSMAEARVAFEKLGEHLELSKALTRYEPAQHEQVLQLEAMVEKRAEYLREILTAKRLDKQESLRSLMAGSSAMLVSGEIRDAVERLDTQEMALLAERDRISYQQGRTTRWTVWWGVGLDVLLITGVAWLIADDILARRKAATALEEANKQLEGKVLERTAELVASNEHLRTENMERRWANQGLDHQLRYNQLIINSIADMVFVVTKAMNISRINPAVVHQTGFEAQDLVGRPFSSIGKESGGSGGATLAEAMGRGLDEGRDLRNQAVVILTKSGLQMPVRLALFPLRDRDRVVGGVVILEVVSKQA
jgi:PAS domain S-box-containing protein